MNDRMLIETDELATAAQTVVFDCRFELADPAAGRGQYLQGHIPGAHYLDLNNDLAGPPAGHGGRHPLPAPEALVALLARHGVEPDTEVVAYDASRFAYAARLWWMMRSIGYRPPRLLNGGYQAWLGAGGRVEIAVPDRRPQVPGGPATFSGYCNVDSLSALQAEGALLVDSREERRYQGLEEPIDPVAGHIPGATNRPWLGVTAADGKLHDIPDLRTHWGEALEAERLVVYCGSGVTACVNLFSLAMLGRDDAMLYPGSWSDWCSYL